MKKTIARNQLLQGLRQLKYTGGADLADIESFLKTAGYDGLTGRDGNGEEFEIDVAASFANGTKAVMIGIEATEGESVEVVDMTAEKMEDEDEMHEEEKAAETRSAAGVPSPRVNSATKAAMGAPAFHHPNSFAAKRKAYAAKMENTRAQAPGFARLSNPEATKFKDAGHAEYFAASLRNSVLLSNPTIAKYYPADIQREDAQILKDAGRGSNIRSVCGKAGSINDPAAGGVLAARGYLADRIYLTEQYGVARRVVRVITMTDGTMDIPRRAGAQSMNHSGENTAATDQDPATDMVTLTAKKIIGLTLVSTELFQDSAIDVADELGAAYAEAQLNREDQDVFLGDGSSSYGGHRGFFNADWITTETVADWDSYGETDHKNLISKPANVVASRQTFVMSRQAFYGTLKSYADGKGGVTATEIVGGVAAGGDADAQIDGWKVHYLNCDNAPVASGSSGEVFASFGDHFGGGVLGDRRQFSVETSEQRYFDSDQIAIRATARIAVNTHGDGRSSGNGPAATLSIA